MGNSVTSIVSTPLGASIINKVYQTKIPVKFSYSNSIGSSFDLSTYMKDTPKKAELSRCGLRLHP